MFTTIIGWSGAFLMLAGCTFALTLGGKNERIGATAYLLCWLFSTLARAGILEKQYSGIAVMLLDITLLIIFASLVWKSSSNWPVWATALQLLVATLQFLYTIDFKPTISAYFTVLNVASVGIIISLIVGTFIAWQERAVIGSSRDDIGRYS
ncbi:hypothetical protein [Brevundimonas terrae]|uniref:hypothetical protein n=1 Tax=Brevundimonas terrae TaxID=363631 RepID=UPI00142410D4|nr:hypothetical protein [Brevundimonas terrae]NIJ26640.1 hypothetical protein [Brevundimonas terrae]